MAKRGLIGADVYPLLRERCASSGWSLCIGAGTSKPAFPSWYELVESLVALDPAATDPKQLATGLAKMFSLDALICAAKDRLGLGEDEFVSHLASMLYARVQSAMTPAEWRRFSRVLIAKDPEQLRFKDCEWFWGKTTEIWPTMSALAIAEFVASTLDTPYRPHSIISFNAEPMLYALLNVVWYKQCREIANGGAPKPTDRIVCMASRMHADRIPYLHCHGLLPVPNSTQMADVNFGVRKLVFSETEYLNLANHAFSWQSATFLDAAVFRTIVFVGVSLADSNMRRWLSWVHRVRLEELGTRPGFDGTSTTHFWINQRPADEASQLWMESAVSHLGVRLVWLDRWDELRGVLDRMLNPM